MKNIVLVLLLILLMSCNTKKYRTVNFVNIDELYMYDHVDKITHGIRLGEESMILTFTEISFSRSKLFLKGNVRLKHEPTPIPYLSVFKGVKNEKEEIILQKIAEGSEEGIFSVKIKIQKNEYIVFSYPGIVPIVYQFK